MPRLGLIDATSTSSSGRIGAIDVLRHESEGMRASWASDWLS
ncbi:MAG: hypothetical protein AAGA56_04615 [Myxococcota bacterium]